jgi:hypothetical protein
MIEYFTDGLINLGFSSIIIVIHNKYSKSTGLKLPTTKYLGRIQNTY